MKKKLTISIVLVLLLALFLTGCGPKDKRIVGTWKSATYGWMEFKASGKYVSGESKLSYEAEDGVLTLSDGKSYYYEITSGVAADGDAVAMLTLWDYGTNGYNMRYYTKS